MLTSSTVSLGTFVSIVTAASNSYTMYTVPAGKNLYVISASGTKMTGFTVTNSSNGGQIEVETPLYTPNNSTQFVLPAGTVIKQDGSGIKGVLVGYVR